MVIKPIHNEEDYLYALHRIEELMDSEMGTPEEDELEILSTLVNAYEERSYPITTPDPIEAIKFRMEQMGINIQELQFIIKARPNRIYEILNRVRPLSLRMIRSLSRELHIPSHVLIQEYPLKESKHLSDTRPS